MAHNSPALRLRIGNDDDLVLDIGLGENALLPTAEDERTKAFRALSGALALLCGLSPECLLASTGERAGMGAVGASSLRLSDT